MTRVSKAARMAVLANRPTRPLLSWRLIEFVAAETPRPLALGPGRAS